MKRVRTVKSTQAINDLQTLWAAIEQVTTRFGDESLKRSFAFYQKYVPPEELRACYDAWNMLLELTRAAMTNRDPAFMRTCFDLVERCEITRNPKLILEPAYVCFWELLSFDGSQKELFRITRLMPLHFRESFLRDHPDLRE